MTTPPRTVSALGALTVLALGVVLLVGSCEVPVPIAVEPEEQEDDNSVYLPTNDVVHVSIGREGSVYLNEQAYPMEDVSEVVGPMYRESEQRLVASIVGSGEVPYQFMDQLQKELVAAGVVRVVYAVQDPLADPAGGPGLLDRSLDLVLAAVRGAYDALVSLASRTAEDEEVPTVMVRGLGHLLPGDTGVRPRSLSSPGLNIAQRNLLQLIVRPNGRVDMRRGESEQIQTVGPEHLEGIWRQDVAENPNLIADVKIHPDAPYRHMVEVLGALHSANAERISLRILEN